MLIYSSLFLRHPTFFFTMEKQVTSADKWQTSADDFSFFSTHFKGTQEREFFGSDFETCVFS